jgi:hypothetical protein
MNKLYQIRKNKKNTKIIFRFCITFLMLSSSIFLFYIIDSNNMAINIIKYKNIENKSNSKIMSNPQIHFEYEGGNFYKIKGESAKYHNNGDIIVKKVTANNNNGNIKAEKLNVTNNGNVIIFTGKPKLEFYGN